MNFEVVNPDPLGVLTSTRSVVESAIHLRVDSASIVRVSEQLQTGELDRPDWQDALHFHDGIWKTAGWILALDALNFCFWSESSDPAKRWRVEYAGQIFDGYWALVAALRRAVDEGITIWDPLVLANISSDQVAVILRPANTADPLIPLFEQRVEHLRELGTGLLRFADERGSESTTRSPVESFITSADGSAACLVDLVTRCFPSFDDTAQSNGQIVRFYKRAQILVADLHGAFGGHGLGSFSDLDALTAFADYKVPQVLRRLGVLEYSEPLARRIDARQLIPAGSREEVEIRAAAIWACELIRQVLEARGTSLRAFEIDWALWQAGQSLPAGTKPYHRTYTVFY
jgi:Queuosine salvage protein